MDAEPADELAELELMARRVAHDLRSPLGALQNYAAVLEESYGPAMGAEGRDILRRMSGSVQSAASVLAELQTFCRVAGQEIHRVVVDMQALLTEVVPAVRARITLPPLAIDPLPAAAGDADLLHTAWEQLLAHAAGLAQGLPGAAIAIGADRDASEANAPPGFVVYRLKLARARAESPEGGLAVANRIVRRHGGRLWTVPSAGPSGSGAGLSLCLSLPEA